MNKLTKEQKQTLIKSIIAGLLSALAVIAAAVGLNSCSATRTITVSSQYFSKGDTSVVIQTKTIESYTANKQK